jgi:hypothetical protein
MSFRDGTDTQVVTEPTPKDASEAPTPAPELLIDCEKDRTLRAVLVGMLRKANRGRAQKAPYRPVGRALRFR